jgi:hypothetical protein
MRAMLVLVFFGLVLAGCSHNATTGQRFGITSIKQIEAGKTDKATVRKLLGPAPQTSITGKNQEVWRYSFSTRTDDSGNAFIIPMAAAAIPVVGFKGNVVSSCVLTRSSTTTSAGTGLANPGARVTRESHDIPCHEVTPQMSGQS